MVRTFGASRAGSGCTLCVGRDDGSQATRFGASAARKIEPCLKASPFIGTRSRCIKAWLGLLKMIPSADEVGQPVALVGFGKRK